MLKIAQMESVNSPSVAKFTHDVYPLNPEDHHRFTLSKSVLDYSHISQNL